ncbi:elongation factor 4, partial [Francisella tularensis subsp. holarctica]|nr:elongation factor 4 [Francisella tularensis subsp. holarctica]
QRGVQVALNYVGNPVSIPYDLPMIEVVSDFFDTLKSVTNGYGSLDYELIRYEPSNMVCLDVLINCDNVDALASILHKDQAKYKG